MSAQDSAGVALVTGANRGIGREVARQLAQRGYRVLLSARDGEKATEAARELVEEGVTGVTPMMLDVSDPQSIAAAAEHVHADPGRLDVLVNNAGIGSDFGVAGVDPDFDAIQRALDTNFFGAYRLTVALLGLLRKSEHPRDRQRVERHGRRRGDGRLVARLPRVEGLDERDDADPVDRAQGRRLPGQLGLPGVREHRHGRPDGREEARAGRGGRHRLAGDAARRRADGRVLSGRQAGGVLSGAADGLAGRPQRTGVGFRLVRFFARTWVATRGGAVW